MEGKKSISSFGSAMSNNSRKALGSSMSLESQAEAKDMDNMMSRGYQNTKMLQMIALLAIPLIILLVVTAVYFAELVNTRNNLVSTSEAVHINSDVVSFADRLQIERSRTTLYAIHHQNLAEAGNNNDAASDTTSTIKTEKLLKAQNDTDKSIIDNLSQNEAIIEYVNDNYGSFDGLRNRINVLRAAALAGVREPLKILEDYTRIIDNIIDWSYSLYAEASLDTLWSPLVSKYALMHGIENLGKLATLGSLLEVQCQFSVEEQIEITEDVSKLQLYFDTAEEFNEEVIDRYLSKHGEEQEIQKLMDSRVADTFSDEWIAACQARSTEEKDVLADVWFDQIDVIALNLVHSLEEFTVEILIEVDTKKAEVETTIIILGSVLAVFTVISLILFAWYIRKVFHLLSLIGGYVIKMKHKNQEILMEKERAEELLAQLMPPEIAEALKERRQVDAEYYDEVTILFSDVVGFTKICSQIKPMHVVELLNNLYGHFDRTIDKFDCYKVQTIGDAYMVSSGVPKRNGHEHARELALASFELHDSMLTFKIEELPDEKVRIRIGMHTGAVVAGVVGIRMPRYCLFGETVTIAEQLESTGKAMNTQLSAEAKEALDKFPDDGFLTSRRYEIVLENGVSTYWLYKKPKEGEAPIAMTT